MQSKNNRKKPDDGNTKNVEIAIPLKYLRNFCRTLKIPLFNCETNLILTWSSICGITNSTCAGIFTITATKLYVVFVTISTQDNIKLLKQLV